MSDFPASPSPLSRLFELSARALHSAGHSHGLFPAQWSTLRYLAHAPRQSRTASALARFQQLAPGPVTRTIRTLIAKGLVMKGGAGEHHRAELLELTPEGREILTRDPLRRLDRVFETATPEERVWLADLFGQLILAQNDDGGGEAPSIALPVPEDDPEP